jgi:uncharacterized protein YggE
MMRKIQSLIMVFITIFSVSVLGNALPDDPHISVTGTATLEVKPDQVIIHFQAKALEKDAALAKQKVDQQVADLLVTLPQAGFTNDALQRASLRIREEYQYINKKRTLQGIRAVRELSYLLTDTSKVNLFLEAVLAANIESIQQMHYGLQSPKKWQLEVRKMAIQDSQEKAANLAAAYQAKLGKIYAINYQQRNVQPMMMRTMKDEVAGSTYQVKNIKISDTVQAIFILKP